MPSAKTETSLLAYVIAYLAEEQDRIGKMAPAGEPSYDIYNPNSVSDIGELVDLAIDAYEGGGGRVKMSHTPEPWFAEVTVNEAGTLKSGQPTATDLGQPEVDLTDLANLSRIVACVNGCAGLNPAAYRECVEALQGLLKYLRPQFEKTKWEAFVKGAGSFQVQPITEAVNALTHATQEASQ